MRVNRAKIEWRQEQDGLYEYRTRILAQIECPRCGAWVECEGETEEWNQHGDRWKHASYGPATGECCGLLLVDSWDGATAYEMEPR